ncbi:GntR family transcriptional regulator [Alicyclobacillus acidiphilus]|uniref:GntR family transcriptional regulator n=1 Tax=Alicyclobacillus acidiphilus TaxID=182455 RepID=UPI00082E8A97|nr:GntR family transcriptional regulator [Alicyclobacillus acidiphilus]
MNEKKSIPKYQVVRTELINRIKSGEFKPGERLPVEADLAESFGVSRQTIRQAIGEMVQIGILERKQGSGTYVLEQSTDAGTKSQTKIIAVITTYITDYIFPEIIRGIVERLSKDTYSPLLYATQNDLTLERKALEDTYLKAVDAVIVEATKGAFPNPNLDLYKQLEDAGIPIVMLHGRYTGLNVPVVDVDDRAGAYLAANHLIDLGHKRIGGIFKVDDIQGLQRMEGFTEALAQSHLAFRAGALSFYTTEEELLVTSQYAERLSLMPGDERPTAVICYNDAIASSLIRDFHAHHIKVPNDISVIGFDDSPIAQLIHPPLTSVSHPKYDVGVCVADVALQSLSGGPLQQRYTFQPKLVVRESTSRFEGM